MSAAQRDTSRKFCVAPMMDRTDRFDRYFLRLISEHSLLYTEMVASKAMVYGDQERLLAFDPAEHPVALQVGGSDPKDLGNCAEIAERLGYDEINLNVGCPSDRVVSGRFGACLMAQPDLVADCVAAMDEASGLPVTVKCRIGIDDQDPAESLFAFVETVAAAGCATFVVHARKALLGGLSPKENRTVPPLDYELVYALKRARPDLTIVINGGIESIAQCDKHLEKVDGVMLGRAAYQNPFLLANVDQRYFGGANTLPARHDLIETYLPYVERQWAAGVPLYAMVRHILGIFHGYPGAKAWRAYLSTHAHLPGASPDVIRDALALVERQDVPSVA